MAESQAKSSGMSPGGGGGSHNESGGDKSPRSSNVGEDDRTKEQPSHGAGNNRRKEGNKSKSSAKSNATKKASTSTVRLTESDPDYPKDVPRDSPFYEKIWLKGLPEEAIDQGLLQICWTIASTTTTAARLLIAKKTRSLKLLSLRHLVVGLFAKIKNDGGLTDLNHLKRFLEEQGAILQKDCKCVDPFSEMKRKKIMDKSKLPTPVLCTHKHQPRSIFRIKELIVRTEVVEEELILMLNKGGPVAISIENHPEFERFKGDGIYEGPRKSSRSLIGYHMLMCMGYATHEGIHYWKVLNSAGPSWGVNGFGKIIRQTSRKEKPSLIKYILCPMLLEDYVDED